MTRREFLKAAGLAAAGIGLGAITPLRWDSDGRSVRIQGPLHLAAQLKWKGEGRVKVLRYLWSTEVLVPPVITRCGELKVSVARKDLFAIRFTPFRVGE